MNRQILQLHIDRQAEQQADRAEQQSDRQQGMSVHARENSRVDKSGSVRLASPPPACSVCPNANVGRSSPATTAAALYRSFSSAPAPSLIEPNLRPAKIFRILAVPISDPITCRAKITAAMSEKTLAPRKNSTQFVTVTYPPCFTFCSRSKNGCSTGISNAGELPREAYHPHTPLSSDCCLRA